MLALAMRMMPSAASSVVMPRGLPIFSLIARREASMSSSILPEAKYCGSRRPSTRLASVTVGSVPPRE